MTASFQTSASMALLKQQSITTKTIRILKNVGFIGGNVNPCLYVKESVKGIVYVALYVDYNLIVEDVEVIDNLSHLSKIVCW